MFKKARAQSNANETVNWLGEMLAAKVVGADFLMPRPNLSPEGRQYLAERHPDGPEVLGLLDAMDTLDAEDPESVASLEKAASALTSKMMGG